ncbi:bifunctional riboflavin kinase/FAD synthetase [Demequina sp. TTPB684]|uniref:bifunctional riboflavin kinase/FAD synthetase n=1 Tax=unclassified Demequina TaxID=2620311 RepID=UPI001CF226E1|nr:MULTISPECIES: bifunctional riboflavin kinase/FAD synthetase [unclassified Demequina]MCB2411606.1 bifunctional riboflavin kinase/FAD synthetase [Demequina sp. TTPB684]UPU89626.1 bifunctional riboflavin kinase/FAD synthetase [Demequina sp. TMPB413]
MTSVWRSLADVPHDLGPTVVTVGNFDGVHLGHQAVLAEVVAAARGANAKAVAVTFDPHPKAVHDPDHTPELITGIEDRIERMAAAGLDGIVVQHYTLDFAMATPEQFVADYLVAGLGAVAIVVGRDTRFGRGNAGDVETLRDMGERLGISVDIVGDAAGSTEGARRWSSTWVRELLEDGDLRGAAEILGAPHRLRGTVVHGDKRGRQIGFPTANLDVYAGYVPRHGVYAGVLTVTDPKDNDAARQWVGTPLPAAISLGFNYTVDSDGLRIEAHVIDRNDLDLYGAQVALDLIEWRRPMLDFGSMNGLIDALREDVVWCRGVLNLR